MSQTQRILQMRTCCQTPAKLILTGEHAVLFGTPALSMAVNFLTQCDMTFSDEAQPRELSFSINLNDYQSQHHFSFLEWHDQIIQIRSRYALYEKNSLAIQTVCRTPVDLVLLSLYFFDSIYPLKKGHWDIQIHSKIPLGRGLGSSASVIISLLHSLYIQHQHPIIEEEILNLAQKVESFQHGHSSGLDTTTIFKGGLIRFQHKQPIEQLVMQNFHGWLIDTGKPDSTTGQAVSQVHQQFHHHHAIWQAFEATAFKIEQGWQASDAIQLKEGITENEQLLENLGVVPERVKAFIKRINQHPNKAAKVCGAGSIQGDKAGVILCLSHQPPTALCEEFGYSLLPITLNEQGSHCEVVF